MSEHPFPLLFIRGLLCLQNRTDTTYQGQGDHPVEVGGRRTVQSAGYYTHLAVKMRRFTDKNILGLYRVAPSLSIRFRCGISFCGILSARTVSNAGDYPTGYLPLSSLSGGAVTYSPKKCENFEGVVWSGFESKKLHQYHFVPLPRGEPFAVIAMCSIKLHTGTFGY